MTASKKSSKSNVGTFKKIQSGLKKAPQKIQKQIDEKLNTKYGRKVSQKISQKIGQQISEQIANQLNSKLATRLNSQAQEAVKQATRTAQMTAQIATETAKHSIDQVLLNLEHRGLNIKDTQDLALKVGRKVLERAEAIRAQLAGNPMSPAWLKDVSLAPMAPEQEKTDRKTEPVEAVAASSLTEASVSEAAKGMAEPSHTEEVEDEDTQPENDEELSRSAKKTRRPQRKSAGASAAK